MQYRLVVARIAPGSSWYRALAPILAVFLLAAVADTVVSAVDPTLPVSNAEED